MKKKMTQEEIDEAQSKKKINKKGAVNSDIILAILIFTLFLASTIFVTRNYTTVLAEYTKKSNALNICVNNINNAKLKSIDTLASYQGTTDINGITYNYIVEVLPYNVAQDEVLDNAKVIISKVTYDVNGKQNEISLKSIKVDNNI